jgi:type III secretion protein V
MAQQNSEAGFPVMNALKAVTSRAESVLMIFVVVILCLMVFSLPPIILDILISINIVLSIAMLFLAIGVKSPLELSTFPTIVVFTTLFRAALNISSTKQILLTGDAGHIIETFGKLVVGGSLLIGAVVFLIISLVQFIVIAKGAERVAEVSARFTLDAMPGKQMSIDSDVRAGSLTKDHAQKRRSELERESQFHGAMDGAMKFVKGDAIVAIVIVGVNVVAGMLVGTVVHGLEFERALSRYSILAIGDGMVSQIPSLLSAIAAGILVTRVGGSEEDALPGASLAGRIADQFLNQPKVLLYCGLASLMFATVPGFPWYVFLTLGLILVSVGFQKAKSTHAVSLVLKVPVKEFQREASRIQAPYLVESDGHHARAFVMETSESVLARIDKDRMIKAVEELRADVAGKLGYMFPGFGLRLNPALTNEQCRFVFYSVPGPHFDVPKQILPLPVPALRHDFPWNRVAFGTALQAGLVPESMAKIPSVVLTLEQWIGLRSLLEISTRANELMSFQEAQEWLNRANEVYPDLVGEFMRAVPTQRLSDCLKLLAADGIPIRHPREIVEAVMTHSPKEKDAQGLTEQVRTALGRLIYSGHLGSAAVMKIQILDQTTEEMLAAGLGDERSAQPVLGDPFWDKVVNEILEEARPDTVLVVAGPIRRALSEYVKLRGGNLNILSKQEIPDNGSIDVVGVLCKDSANLEM